MTMTAELTTDRKLLELAAKAAEIGLVWDPERECACRLAGTSREWNPLEDDGDALRLAVKLNLQVTPGTFRPHEATAFHAGAGEAHERVHYQQDIFAATRRAIVKAAAQIARQ